MIEALATPSALPNLNIQPGEHVIALMSRYSDIDALVKYLEQMQEEAGHGVVVAAPAQQDELSSLDIVNANQSVQMHDPLEMGFCNGHFDPEHFLAQTDAAVNRLTSRGVERIFHSGVMRWLNDAQVSEEDAIYLEARINQNVEGTCMSGLCVYDVSCIGSHLLMQLLRTHPKVVMDDRIVENPFYERPEDVIRQLGRG